MSLASFRLLALGRSVLASLFILGGLNKVPNFSTTVADMAAAGLPLPYLLLPVVIVVELVGGLWVAFAWRHVTWVALGLAAHTVLVNLLFHPFWAMEGDLAALELSLFFKNVSIIGGLLMVAALGTATGDARHGAHQ